jgi:Fe/S biogenesis protein NfuA
MEDASKDTRTRIQEMIDYQINPAVAGHGGFIEFIDFKDGTVYLRMGGGCQGCGMANVTLKQGIERMLREEIPEIQQIMDVTDHAGGSNPYYQPSK